MKHISLFEAYSELPNISLEEIKNMTPDQFLMKIENLLSAGDKEQAFTIFQIWMKANPDMAKTDDITTWLGKIDSSFEDFIDDKMERNPYKDSLNKAKEDKEALLRKKRSPQTREELIEVLKESDFYLYTEKGNLEIEGDKIVINHKGGFSASLETIPPGVELEFKNLGDVWLTDLKSIPPGVEFNNKGNVSLTSLETLPPGVEFNNGGHVWLTDLKSIPPGVEFNNGGGVSLTSIVGDGNGLSIKGIHDRRLLNLMIIKGMFI